MSARSARSKKKRATLSLEEDPVIKKGEHFMVLLECPNVTTVEVAAEVLEEKLFNVPNPMLKDKKGILPVLAPRLAETAKEVLERAKETSKKRGKKRGGRSRETPKNVSFTLYYVHYHSRDRRMDRWLPSWKFIKRIPSETANLPTGPVRTRSKTRFAQEFSHEPKDPKSMSAKDASIEKEWQELTKIKLVEAVRFSKHIIETWYYSPYPEIYTQNGIILICEFCLLYTFDIVEFHCHKGKACKKRKPPGTEIYRKDKLTVFKVNGHEDKFYCRSLCLLGKLFLDHKSLLYEVDKFIFYVLCETHGDGSEHPVGFFSKESAIPENNLACIMILPPHQCKGYGSFLVQLSYELSLRDGVIAGPEYPLSDTGRTLYRKYWTTALGLLFRKIGLNNPISVKQLSKLTGYRDFDISYVIDVWKLVDSQCVETRKDGDVTVVVLKHALSPGKRPRIIMDYNLLRT
uniref:Histone acetyltransferase n=1 Tax=Steinernema glaseri TaxID=37863 RepID=A0A1I7YWR4_9BILA